MRQQRSQTNTDIFCQKVSLTASHFKRNEFNFSELDDREGGKQLEEKEEIWETKILVVKNDYF